MRRPTARGPIRRRAIPTTFAGDGRTKVETWMPHYLALPRRGYTDQPTTAVTPMGAEGARAVIGRPRTGQRVLPPARCAAGAAACMRLSCNAERCGLDRNANRR